MTSVPFLTEMLKSFIEMMVANKIVALNTLTKHNYIDEKKVRNDLKFVKALLMLHLLCSLNKQKFLLKK